MNHNAIHIAFHRIGKALGIKYDPGSIDEMTLNTNLHDLAAMFHPPYICITLEGWAICHPPQRHTPGSVGYDLVADIADSRVIHRHRVFNIPTGLRIAIPAGFKGQVCLRSSTAQRGLYSPSGSGVIDADYRGVVHVELSAMNEDVKVYPGERIAQLVISPVWLGELCLVEELDRTERGSSGFGSTGR